MTVGELVDLLLQVDRERTVYVPGEDVCPEPAALVVDMQHVNLPEEWRGITISDDVAILPQSFADRLEGDDGQDG